MQKPPPCMSMIVGLFRKWGLGSGRFSPPDWAFRFSCSLSPFRASRSSCLDSQHTNSPRRPFGSVTLRKHDDRCWGSDEYILLHAGVR